MSRATFEAATRAVEPDLSLPDLDLPGRSAPPRGQAEFVQTPADYVKEANIANLAGQAKKLATQHGPTLAAIEQKFGVPGNVLLAIWGRETAFGSYKLPKPGITVLATQAYYGRRKDMFRQELLYALKMLEEGHIKLSEMRASWGGAMGLTQFLPSEFYKYGVDFDGDGRRDIWHSVPDALASAAKQLADKGWQPGRRWAYEVHAPWAMSTARSRPGGQAAGQRLAQERLCAGYRRSRRRRAPRRLAVSRGHHVSLSDAIKVITSQPISPTSTCCLSAI